LDDVCLNYVCGGDEQGYCDEVDGNAKCMCYDGWTGDFCVVPAVSCSATQFLDLVQQLMLIEPDYKSDCVYMTTQIWTMVPVTDTIPALCDCLNNMQENLPDAFEDLDCAFDQGMTLTRAIEEYCPIGVTQTDIDEMLLRVSTLDENCHHFVYDRVSMPLYRQEKYKCDCLLSVADTYEDAVEIFNVPFAMHTASTGAVAWTSCSEGSVCDYSGINDQLLDVMFQIDPFAAEYCMTSISMISGVTPNDKEVYELTDYLCPCLSGIETKWWEGIELFNCKHVSYSELTLKEMMQSMCQDTQFKSTTCTYTLTEYVYTLSATDFPAATNCLQAMKLGDQIVDTNDNFDEIFCTCYQSLATVEDFDPSIIDDCAVEIDWVVPSPKSYCEDYLGTTFSFTASTKEVTSTKDVEPETIEIVEAATSSSSGSSFWMAIGIVCLCLLVPVIALNIWLLFAIKRSGYRKQKDASGKEVMKGDEGTYQTAD